MGFWQSLKNKVAGSPKGPEEHFVEQYRALALEHPSVERVERSPGDPMLLLIFRAGADEPMKSFLGNIFRETRDLSPEEKTARIRAALSVLDHEGEELSWDDAQTCLVPLVRVESLVFGIPNASPLSKPFLPFVNVYAGLDRDQTIQFVTESQPGAWEVDAARVFEAAIEVLANHHQESDIEPFDPEAPYPIWHVTRDDSYESSRLALPGFLASFRGKVSGRPIAIIPERSSCIVSGDGSPEAIERLARYAEKQWESAPRSLSPALYALGDDGRVVPFHLPKTHPHHFLVERGHHLLAATTYADQKVMLEKRHEETGTDIFVASLSMISYETGQTTTYATFLKGIDTLMPEADLMAVDEGEGGWGGMVPWAKVFEHARNCFEQDPSLSPRRWRTVAWPSDEAFAKIRASALEEFRR